MSDSIDSAKIIEINHANEQTHAHNDRQLDLYTNVTPVLYNNSNQIDSTELGETR